jgi:tetratricopeptide (TPR) repeat protein
MKKELYTILAYLEHEEDDILITRNSILKLDVSQPDMLENKIEYLTDFIDQASLKNHDYLGYYYLFLGCIYYEKGEYDNVILSLQRANPELWESQINKALVHWLLGVNYSCMNKYPKAQEELKDALNILWVNTRANSYQAEEQQQLKSVIRERINQAIINLDDKSMHYIAPANLHESKERSSFFGRRKENKNQEETASTPKITESRLVSKNKPTLKTPPQTISKNKTNIRHIIVPVDIGALEDQQPNAIPLNHELFDKLKIYNHLDANPPKNTPPSSKTSTEKHIVIPGFSIYGHVSAGPNGEALLSDSEILGQSSETYEDMRIKIEGREYEVKSINSPIPTFLKSKAYGWLKVTGESMNKTSPHPILPNDYVLFCENHNFETCIRKIVIARVSELEGYPPRTIVKRLIKMSGETSHQEDGYATELHKFLLHSESSLEHDPISGASFKKDIEIEREYQIAGEVIAIAKPV